MISEPKLDSDHSVLFRNELNSTNHILAYLQNEEMNAIQIMVCRQAFVVSVGISLIQFLIVGAVCQNANNLPTSEVTPPEASFRDANSAATGIGIPKTGDVATTSNFEKVELETTVNVHRFGSIFFAGQFGALAAKAVDYIDRQTNVDQDNEKKQSVRPGINKDFVDPDLDVDEYIARFEIESREVFVARHEILRACGIKSGDRIADIGAGTGLFTRMFSVTTGNQGWVYAVEIAPRFIEHINREANKYGLTNITCVLCQEDSVNLPPKSIDVAFICDTYHHFEFPESTMRSLHRALKDTGHVIVVDFEREPAKSREWILNHVRAGKDEVLREIQSFGFELDEEIKVGGLLENYCLKFRKAHDGDSSTDKDDHDIVDDNQDN